MEILMVTGLLAYIMNYIIGKNKNSRLAQAWFNSHRELLESNFALVGRCTSLFTLFLLLLMLFSQTLFLSDSQMCFYF